MPIMPIMATTIIISIKVSAREAARASGVEAVVANYCHLSYLIVTCRDKFLQPRLIPKSSAIALFLQIECNSRRNISKRKFVDGKIPHL